MTCLDSCIWKNCVPLAAFWDSRKFYWYFIQKCAPRGTLWWLTLCSAPHFYMLHILWLYLENARNKASHEQLRFPSFFSLFISGVGDGSISDQAESMSKFCRLKITGNEFNFQVNLNFEIFWQNCISYLFCWFDKIAWTLNWNPCIEPMSLINTITDSKVINRAYGAFDE